MNIWITGTGGFIGSHLAEQLTQLGHTVHGNDNYICGSPANVPTGVKNHLIDCCNENIVHLMQLAKPDVLVHCAATAHEGLSSFSPSFITKNIYQASVNMFSAAIASGVKRIVFLSSMARYGAGIPPFIETAITQPVDPYGVAKVAAEETLKILCNTHGVQWAIAVPHNVIGIRQRYVDPYRNVASIMMNRVLMDKPPIVYGDGQQKRCFSPIADCLPSLVGMVYGKADGEVVNIGPDGGEITILELAHKIITISGKNLKPKHFDGRPNEVKYAYTSSNKAREMLNYREIQPLDDCLKEMYLDIARQGARDFIYGFPLEIINDKIPKTWLERLM